MATLTAGDVVSRVKSNLGIPWRDTTYRDTFKFGGPDTEVRGIATAMFCNLDVMKAAVEAGCNFLIPHEDTWWNDRDDISIVSTDPLYKTKVDFMKEHNIVIFRIHDHMHSQRPDFTYVGLAQRRPSLITLSFRKQIWARSRPIFKNASECIRFARSAIRT
jgi:hypothetical protein